MRQVMPHRNNIDLRGAECKMILRLSAAIAGGAAKLSQFWRRHFAGKTAAAKLPSDITIVYIDTDWPPVPSPQTNEYITYASAA